MQGFKEESQQAPIEMTASLPGLQAILQDALAGEAATSLAGLSTRTRILPGLAGKLRRSRYAAENCHGFRYRARFVKGLIARPSSKHQAGSQE